MYLGIDFLLAPDLKIFVVDVNLGLPGGAEEYERANLVKNRQSSGIFERIEETARTVYGLSFREYLNALPFVPGLKQMKLWMDGKGELPEEIHPALRLEDKWIQYGLLHDRVPMPETMLLDPLRPAAAEAFLEAKAQAVLKPRAGRGGRGLTLITDAGSLRIRSDKPCQILLQEYIASRAADHTLSIRSVAFGGRFLCMYANLSSTAVSNHGIVTSVSSGGYFGLENRTFGTRVFNRKSWEAGIWFGENTPPYLRHNLYEDEVSDTTLFLPDPVVQEIVRRSVQIERLYEALDLERLPRACFEDSRHE